MTHRDLYDIIRNLGCFAWLVIVAISGIGLVKILLEVL